MQRIAFWKRVTTNRALTSVILLGLFACALFIASALRDPDPSTYVWDHLWEALGLPLAVIATILASLDAREGAEMAQAAMTTWPINSFPDVVLDVAKLVGRAEERQHRIGRGRQVEVLVLCDFVAYGFWSGRAYCREYLNALSRFHDAGGRITMVVRHESGAAAMIARQFGSEFFRPGGKFSGRFETNFRAFLRGERLTREESRIHPGLDVQVFAEILRDRAFAFTRGLAQFLTFRRSPADIHMFVWAVRERDLPSPGDEPEADPVSTPVEAVFIVTNYEDRDREPAFRTEWADLVRSLAKLVSGYHRDALPERPPAPLGKSPGRVDGRAEVA